MEDPEHIIALCRLRLTESFRVRSNLMAAHVVRSAMVCGSSSLKEGPPGRKRFAASTPRGAVSGCEKTVTATKES